MRLWASTFATACLLAQPADFTFGTTAVSTSALQGKIYLISKDTERLPRFEELKSVGNIYTHSLNIWPQDFRQGFPGVTDRLEWFAIDYTGKFWVEQEGLFRFGMVADDGAMLWIDDELVIDLDGTHAAISASSTAKLTRGVHRIRVAYYQGPAFHVALVLSIAPPQRPFEIFHTDNFLPPKDPTHWLDGRIAGVQQIRNPYVTAERPPQRRSRQRR